MSSYSDRGYDAPPGASMGFKAAFAMGGLILLLAVIWGVRNLLTAPAVPPHQTAKIVLLPDQPPPPPPKEEKKPEPKQEAKQQQVETPQKATPPPPEPQQLKMEGAAGDAPSPFSAGEVKEDYKGGEIGGGDDRYKYAAYVSRLTQEIQEKLTRRKLRDSSGRILLWLDAGGGVQRFKLLRSSGDAASEQLLQAAFSELGHVHEAPPADMPMPIGLDISTQ